MSRRTVLRRMKCPSRIAKGEKPYCVNSCPCDALSIGEDAEAKSAELRESGFRFFELPVWEKSKDDVLYAEKK